MLSIISFVTGGLGRWVVLAVAIAASYGWVWYQGDEHGTAKLTAFVLKENQEEARVKSLRDHITTQVENDHAKKDADTVAAYESAIRVLNAGSGAKPVPVDTHVCETAAANNGLSDAVSGYLERQRQIIASERASVAGLLEQAERNTKSLVDTQSWLTQQGEVK